MTAATTSDRLLKWAPRSEGIDAAELDRCVRAATGALESALRRRLSYATYSAIHSGARAATAGHLLWLADPASGYATLPVASVESVVEDGVALTPVVVSGSMQIPDGALALVYPDDGVIARAIGSGGFAHRVPWSPREFNVRVEIAAGYRIDDVDDKDGAADAPALPDEIEQIVYELAWLIHREGARNGLEQLVETGVNLTFVRLLSPTCQRTLERLSLPRRPRTMEG